MATVLVTGASGTLGSAVVPRLAAAGWRVRPASRRDRPGWATLDLATGAGLDAAVAGVAAVVHLASSPRRTRETDVAGTRRLVEAAARAGAGHLLYVSIIGVDRVPLAYYRHKLAAERLVGAGTVPFTVLRAAQFPSLLDGLLRATSRLGPVPVDRRVLFQPVAVEDVADRIAGLLAEAPVGGVVEFAGPRTLTYEQVARAWLAARGSRRPLLPVRVPGRFGRELRAGALTTTATPAGVRTWEDWLAAGR